VKQVQKRKKVVIRRALMIKQVTDKKQRNESFRGSKGLDIVIDNNESVVEVMSSITSDDLRVTY